MRNRLPFRSLLVAIPVVALLLVSLGCQGFWVNFTVDKTAAVMRRAVAATNAEPDTKLAREATPGSLKMVDGFLAASPQQRDLLELVAMAYTQYAFGFLEDDLEEMGPEETPARRQLLERVTGLYDRGLEVALRLLALDGKRIPMLFRGEMPSFERAIGRLGRQAAPGLYWAGMALGAAINLNRDNVDRVADLPRAIALLERARQVDPAYFHHGASMALGAFYCSQGKAVGGDPEKGKRMFAEAIAATSGKYLLARVLLARTCAAITLDRELYEKTLREVLATPAAVWAAERLANELARRRAARYLKQADDLF